MQHLARLNTKLSQVIGNKIIKETCLTATVSKMYRRVWQLCFGALQHLVWFALYLCHISLYVQQDCRYRSPWSPWWWWRLIMSPLKVIILMKRLVSTDFISGEKWQIFAKIQGFEVKISKTWTFALASLCPSPFE